MAHVNIGTIVSAVADTLKSVSGITNIQDFDELSSAPATTYDTPMVQIYPDRTEGTSSNRQTDRVTFGAAIRMTNVVINVDLFSRHRSLIGEDMAALLPHIDAVEEVFEAQKTPPAFGLDSVKNFSWRWEQVIFDYSGKKFIGARFELVLSIY